MIKTNSLLAMFLILVLATGTISPSFAQSTSNIFVKLNLAPESVDKKNSVHSIGYVNLVNKNGMSIKAPTDLTIQLKSENPSINVTKILLPIVFCRLVEYLLP